MKKSAPKSPLGAAAGLPPCGRMTSALWSCERHQQLCFASADGRATALRRDDARTAVRPELQPLAEAV